MYAVTEFIIKSFCVFCAYVLCSIMCLEKENILYNSSLTLDNWYVFCVMFLSFILGFILQANPSSKVLRILYQVQLRTSL